jgi:hypothetical protein
MKKGSKMQYPPTNNKGPTDNFPADKLINPMAMKARESHSRVVLRKKFMVPFILDQMLSNFIPLVQ